MLEKLLKLGSFDNSEPLGSSLGHCSCFFRGARHSLSGLTCCPWPFRMFGFHCSYINISFPTWWSLYSSWCNGTCKDWYLSFLGHITKYLCIVTWGCPITCLAFWKCYSVIISPNVVFFGGPTPQAGIYFAFNKCSFGCHANTSLLLCRSNNKGLVISLS
jgi:hypothetical protein